MRTRDRPQPPHGVLHQVGDVDALGLDLQRAGADAAQLEGVPHEAFQAFGLVGDRLEQLPAFFGFDARPRRKERSRGGLHRGQRCAQVVTDGGEEAGALAPDLGDEARLAHLLLQPQPIDAGREPRDQCFQQFTIGRARIVGTTGRAG